MIKEYIVVIKVKTDANIVHVAQAVNNAMQHINSTTKILFEAEVENIGLRFKNED